jgi:type III secretion protein C
MMNWNLRTCWQALLPCAFLLADETLAAVPEEWKNTPYAHEANHRALRGFCRTSPIPWACNCKLTGRCRVS